MKLKFGTVAFSYAGSYMAFSYPQDKGDGYENDLTLRNIYGLFEDQDNFPIYLLDEREQRLEGTISCSESELLLKSGQYELRMCFQDANTVWLKANTKVIITKRCSNEYDRVMCHSDGIWEMTGNHASMMFYTHEGVIDNKSLYSSNGQTCIKSCLEMIPSNNGTFLCQVTLAGLSYQKPEESTYEASLIRTKQIYNKFSLKYKTKIRRYIETVNEAAYIIWSSIVKPEGYVKYPTILMSKNKMNMVWSWDYAINAFAIVDKNPELAYDQFLAIIESQDEYGAYADCFSARNMIRNFVKPPIQGFVLKKMFEIEEPSRDIKIRLYNSVKKFTIWWFAYRGYEDGIPEYHHGNDSGWDNSTVFSRGLPVQSPDLCAWLVEQMDFLAILAEQLGLSEEANEWATKSKTLCSDILKYFVKDGEFIAYKVPEMQTVSCDSLLLYIPLILGERLPEKIRKNMLEKLLNRDMFFTDYGFASEALNSEYFMEDGYWRGAIWPPTAWIFVEILYRNGKYSAALESAKSFCELCRKYGFFENYSAIDGHGLRDSGYTWSASVFLILLRDYLEKEKF